MPEVGYTTVVAAPVERVWDYVENLHNWCELMVGYQALDIVDDRRSIWTLRGDVGILSREVKIQVDITEWLPLDRVSFVVTGLTERLEGAGAFILQRVDAADDQAAPVDPAAPAADIPSSSAPQKKDSLLRRARFALVRLILRRVGRKALRTRQSTQAASPAAAAVTSTTPPESSAETSPARSRLEFQLRVSPSGPMAPMIEVLMSPMLEPAAIDLADGIRRAVEG
jgi:hypothetical protein